MELVVTTLWEPVTLVSRATMDYAISHVMSEYTNDTKIKKGFIHSSILSIDCSFE